MVGEEGFEPTQPLATDLQSVVTLQLHRSPTLFKIYSAGFGKPLPGFRLPKDTSAKNSGLP